MDKVDSLRKGSFFWREASAPRPFHILALTLPGLPDLSVAIAAGRAGALGVLDLEFAPDADSALSAAEELAARARSACGIKLSGTESAVTDKVLSGLDGKIGVVILTFGNPAILRGSVEALHHQGRTVVVEVRSLEQATIAENLGADGVIVKGNEAAGIVGEKSTFVLLQQIAPRLSVPVLAQGGIGPHTAAACYAAGAAGVVLDSQLSLTMESPLPEDVRRRIGRMDGTETVCAGGEGTFCRFYAPPGSRNDFADELDVPESCGCGTEGEYELVSGWREKIVKRLSWDGEESSIWLLGQDAVLAASFAGKWKTVGSLCRAMIRSVHDHVGKVKKSNPLATGSPLARELGTVYPIVQGPMARVSDNAGFIASVADGGGLPVAALSQLSGESINKLLKEVVDLVGSRPWGVGILGFNKPELLRSQLEAIKPFSPPFAVLAGGMPGQSAELEAGGTKTFVHVQSADVMEMFVEGGVRRLIFEGRECGGHVGPRASFVLWEDMTGRLFKLIRSGVDPKELQVLFAGGIHDALSAAMVSAMAATLADAGVRVGVVMGTAYLFTDEIVGTGAVLKNYQENALSCSGTAVIESGRGHAIRCCRTPFVGTFDGEKRSLCERKVPHDEMRSRLDAMIMGRLRIASRGVVRKGADPGRSDEPCLVEVGHDRQHEEGIYMIGQLAALKDRTFSIDELHRDVSEKSAGIVSALSLPSLVDEKRVAGKPCDVAIVGMACLLPKAGDIKTYWENILNKKNAITEIPRHRWDWRLYFDEERNARDRIYSKWGGFMDDMAFDPTRYGLPPKSVESVDPMQLMALEVARRTLIDAGYEDREFDRDRVSVILGVSGGAGDVGMQYGLRAELPRFKGDLPESVAGRLPEWTEDTFAGILINVISGRIANRLDLGGTNFTTDAACASSLAALYQAVGELTAGRSDMVLAGGVDTAQGPFGYLCFSKTQALSPRGRCATFDDSADGIVIAEGIAMIALKRLSDAERDGDRIYAVIRGIGGSSDGKARGLTAPLPAGQLRALHRAYEQAGFGPETVGLFEAHGTGTVAGDTAELESTTALLREAGATARQAAIGSVKTLIGHTKATAGVAGLIKACLALYHRALPPHFGVTHPNRVLLAPDSPLYLLDQARPWLAAGDERRRAGVSAFGFGGTNFHVVLEEYAGEHRPWLHTAVSRRWPAELLLWREEDRESLAGRLTHMREQIEKTPDVELRDLAYNLARTCRNGGETLAVVASDPGDLVDKIGIALSYFAGERPALPPGIYYRSGGSTDAGVAVLFSGQGSQYTGMFRELAVSFPVFADTISDADSLLSGSFDARFGKDMTLSRFIYPRGTYDEASAAESMRALTSTDVAQPALGAVGAGLWRLLKTMGIEAGMLGGHSYGEFVALYAGGLIDFDSLMRLSEARGRSIVDAVGGADSELGTMAAVRAERERVEELVAGIEGVLVANHNAPKQCVISGSSAGIEKAAAVMSEAGILVTKIPVSAAFHSPYTEPARSALAEVIASTRWNEGRIPVYSNTTGEPHSRDLGRVAEVMTDHLVKPVEFVAEVEAMYRDGARVFLELGPKSVLAGLVGRILEGRPHTAVAIDGSGGGLTGLLHALGRLIGSGVMPDVMKLFEGRGCVRGDPDKPAGLRRSEPVGKNTWMLNGSRARRASEPVKQIGVVMDELGSRSADAPEGDDRRSPEPLNSAVPPGRAAPGRYQRREEGGRRQQPPSGDPAVMAGFFDMMRQFLETQERIMSMYMGMSADSDQSQPRRRLRRSSGSTGRALGRRAERGYRPPRPDFVPAAPSERPEQVVAEISGEKADASAVEPVSVPGGTDTGQALPDRGKLTDTLLGIIEEKTGYPPDMVGLNQNLEADLGIDSIKRVEIVGALLKALPPDYTKALGKDLGGLNTAPTLNSMLEILEKTSGKGEENNVSEEASPEDGGKPAMDTGPGLPFRYVIEPEEENPDESAVRRLAEGHFIITGDAIGIASELSGMLIARGRTVSMIGSDLLGDEDSLKNWCLSQEAGTGKIAGLVHLAQVGSDPLPPDTASDVWRSLLGINEKSLFILLHDLSGRLSDDATIVSASSLGGFFGRKNNSLNGLSLQGGAVGLLKSLREERPDLRVRAVDVDPEQGAAEIAKSLLAEIELSGGRQEVGYPGGIRTIFRTVPKAIDAVETGAGSLTGLTVLATGGLKGVTAELLRELALPGNTLLLTGRSRLPEEEPDDLKAADTPSALREYFIGEVRAGRLSLTPAEIGQKVQSVLSAREMLLNIDDFRKRGAKVAYFPVDVTSDDAMAGLMRDIHENYGEISGVVHGAGVIEDRLLADKAAGSWSRVVETKVMGLLLLQRYLRPESLKFFTVMSSVAGRYGNSGQTDYATANELMNRLCCQLGRIWGDKVKVRAFCWGPWGPTTFGTGMVTPETEAKFAQKGVSLVKADAARRLFRDELTCQGSGHVEVVCGEGSWERHETDAGRIELDTSSAGNGIPAPLLGNAALTELPEGDRVLSFSPGEEHAYLEEHRIDDIPVLPAAAALEIMAEAVGFLYPGWNVVEVRDCRLLKGIELGEKDRRLDVIVHSPTASNGGFEVRADIQSGLEGERPRPHYRSLLHLERRLPDGFVRVPGQHDEKRLTVEKAYDEWLFHGPRFRVIEKIEGLSESGALSSVRTTSPSEWLVDGGAAGRKWIFDPAIVDSAAQMGLLWARAFRDESALPARFGRVVRYVEALPAKLTMNFELLRSEGPHSVRANVYFSDEKNNVVMLIEEMECISSAELNRLGGTAGTSRLSAGEE